MSVNFRPVRGHEFCPSCQSRFIVSNNFICCGNAPAKLFISVAGPAARAATGKKVVEIHADLYGPFDYRRAALAAAKIESDIKAGVFSLADWLPDQSMRFGPLAGEFLLYMKKRADEGLIAHNNYLNVKSYFRHFTPLAGRPVRGLGAGHIEDFFLTLKASENTKKDLVGYLRHFFKWMSARKYVKEIPILPEFRPVKIKRTPPTPEVHEAIFNSIPDDHRPFAEFYRATAWRMNAVEALQIGSIDLDERLVYLRAAMDGYRLRPSAKIRDKTGSAFPLERVAPFIEAALNQRGLSLAGRELIWRKDDFVFQYMPTRGVNKGHWIPYRHSYFERIFKEVCKELTNKTGDHRFLTATPYTWSKHYLVTEMIKAGVPLQDIAHTVGVEVKVLIHHYGSIDASIKVKSLEILDAYRKNRGP